MSIIQTIAWNSDAVLRALQIDPLRIISINRQEREHLLQSGTSLSARQYSAYLIASGLIFFFAYSLVYLLIAIVFLLDITYLLLALPLGIFGMVLARYHFRSMVASRAREVDVNLLDALRHLVSELKGGNTMTSSLAYVAQANYGPVSELLREALIYLREGASIESAFREVSQRTPSERFSRFALSLGYAMATGHNLVQVLEKSIQDLELTQRSEVGIYTNEATKLSMFAVVLTGVLPGILLFALAQGSFVFGMKPPVELFFIAYLLFFPLLKYHMQAQLARISPGV